MTWSAWLVETTTGAVGPQVPLAAGGSWEITLNGIESWTLSLPDRWLDTVPRRWWNKWQASALICHSCPLWPEDHPWVLGPVTSVPKASTVTSADKQKTVIDTLSGTGLREILRWRKITGVVDWTSNDALDALKNSVATFTGMSLGTIQEEIVRLAIARKAGRLPIRFDERWRQTGLAQDDGHTRNYEGWNVANNDADKLITELSEVIGGPDFMLRPGLDTRADDVWRAYATCLHGLEGQPWLPQERQIVWDATAPNGPVYGLDPAADAGGIRTRRWATGAGEGAGIAMQVSEDDGALADGMPLLEQSAAYQSVTNLPPLLDHAQADLAASSKPTVQLDLKVRGDHPQAVVGSWHVGDRVQVITPRLRDLDAGEHLMTIISARGGLDSEEIAVQLQED
ncbi:hypothetical protein GCM10009785_01660 [Brooklawnia cerclae]|uniref:Uncharacterized protein n=1 Tax=Brooklawnia cerclae TaxID=349934 RepID=A0ABX0SCY0_9ACTN|nr:hypothetical protein [Brooklawnia cerclae]NIH56240.1 hypothetical protein [Brooklawnia cerclae]